LGPYEALLALEDGTYFSGFGFGSPSEVSGEVVFNTGMVGYPEALTDPSYHGQILVQTYPLMGNYGVPPRERRDGYGLPWDLESGRIQVRGYAAYSPSARPSHWTSGRTLDGWLAEEGVPAIGGIDTRKLTKKLRMEGTMLGILKVGRGIDSEEVRGRLHGIPDPGRMDLVKEVTIQEPIFHGGDGPEVVVIDCGVKLGIIRSLLLRGASVIRVPYAYAADEILALDPAGVLISNGPGEPKMCVETIEAVGELIEAGLPMMGICLGSQLLALASGGDTYKLKFGHRGQNHPCIDLSSGRCYITSQNHGYAVEGGSLGDTGFEAYFVNANDGTIEGIRHRRRPVFGVQFHPEGSPGPLESEFLFDAFMKEVEACRG